MNNPMEECPPDEIVRELTIQCRLEHREGEGKRTNGWLWRVRIPEMKYEGWTRNLTKLLAVEVGTIEEVNEELITGEEAWQKDQRKLTETALGLHDHDKDQREKLRSKWPSVSPPETMTPGRCTSDNGFTR